METAARKAALASGVPTYVTKIATIPHLPEGYYTNHWIDELHNLLLPCPI